MTTTTESPDDLLTSGQAARVYGVQAGTWRTMVKRGQTVDPDYVEPMTGFKFWKRSTIEAARDAKPGHGTRNDLIRRCIVTDATAGLHKGKDTWAIVVRTERGQVLSRKRICEGHTSFARGQLAERGYTNDDGHAMAVEPWPSRGGAKR